MPNELYSVRQIRNIEENATSALSEEQLMARAGQAAFERILEYFPYSQRVAVFCGVGNNGGDGFVIAGLLQKKGINVEVYVVGDINRLATAASKAYKELDAFGVKVTLFTPGIEISECDLVVDALLGIGLQGEVRIDYQQAIEVVNKLETAVVAVDVPSGICSDTGAVLGQAVSASLTVTFIGLKQGLFTGAAVDYCGEIVTDTLGLDDVIVESPVSALRVDAYDLDYLIPERARCSHKGDYGHVVVIGGDYGMAGAVRLSAEAALRVGAGRVTVLTRHEHVTAIVATRPELMCYGIGENDDGIIDAVLSKADVCVAGPGLTDSEWSNQLMCKVFAFSGLKVLDAGALPYLESLNGARCLNTIITPHPGEAAHLLGGSSTQVQSNRFKAACQLVEKYADVVILKGAGTIIQSIDELPFLCPLGGPGLASAGTGDVLCGLVGGLSGQKLSASDAALAAVILHAQSADLAVEKKGELGLIASDLFETLANCLMVDRLHYEWVETHD